MIRSAIFEDKPDLRDGLVELLEMEDDIHCCGAWENCDHVKRVVEQHRPDVILMDIDMPGTNGIEGLKIVKKNFPSVNVIMLTVFEDDNYVFEAMCHGASGYLLKNTEPEKIIQGIHDVHNGGSPMTAHIARKVLNLFSAYMPKPEEQINLTPREKDILSSLVRGNSYKMIAQEQNITIETVRGHIKKIYEKLQVHSMSEAVAKAIKQRLV